MIKKELYGKKEVNTFEFVAQEEKKLVDLQTDLKKEEGKKKQDKDVINEKKEVLQKQKER